MMRLPREELVVGSGQNEPTYTEVFVEPREVC
jgi:hypothetical protein